MLIHERLNHMSIKRMIDAYKRGAFVGIHLPRSVLGKKFRDMCVKCSVCAQVKATRHSFRGPTVNLENELADMANVAGKRIHFDTAIFTSVPSRNGYIASHNFTDEAIFRVHCVLTKSMDGTSFIAALKHVKRNNHDRYNLQWEVIHSNNPILFNDRVVKDWLSENGIRIERALTDTPNMNGIAESTKKLLSQATMATLMTSGLPIAFWDDIYQVSEMIMNMSPCRTVLGFRAPNKF